MALTRTGGEPFSSHVPNIMGNQFFFLKKRTTYK